MGAIGPILAMIDSYRDNRKMRRKKSIFRKDRMFETDTQTAYEHTNISLDIRKLSEAEKKVFHDRTIKIRKRENWIKWTLLIVLLVPVVLVLVKIHQSTGGKDHIILTQKDLAIAEEQRERFLFYLSDADSWALKQKWSNAIYQYKNALSIRPADYIANYRLARAYVLNCRSNQETCEEALTLLNELIQKFPDKVNLYELRAEYYLDNNMSDEASKDYEIIESLSGE